MIENKRFTETISTGIVIDNKTGMEYSCEMRINDDFLNLVNTIADENEQLKKEKEFWKSDACSLSSLNSILSNELGIAQEQGYEPSAPYKEYITSIRMEYDKFWENKIKTHNNRLKELEND